MASFESVDISSAWLSGSAKTATKASVVGSLPTAISGGAALLLYGQIIILGGTTFQADTPNPNVFILDPSENYSVTTLSETISLTFDKATYINTKSK